VGLDRLQAALDELSGSAAAKAAVWTAAALICLEAGDAGKMQALAGKFREAGIACECFLEPKKAAQQYMLAEKKGIPWAVIAEGNGVTLRNLATRTDMKGLAVSEAVSVIRASI